jgi:gliding motility-associated-like protein
LPAGFYQLTATDTSGCSQVIFAANIPQIGKPGFDAGALKIFDDTCNAARGSILHLKTRDSSRIDSLRAYTWTWYNDRQEIINTTPNNLYYLEQGTYYATITDQFNCTTTSDPITVLNKEMIPAKPQADNQYIARNTATQITVLNPQKGMYQLLNDGLPGSIPLATSVNGILQTPVIPADRTFFIQYADGDCESPLSEVEIKVFDSTIIYVPGAFTPNNDGLNDRFHVTVKGRIKEFHISVYNRFGSLVYSSNDADRSWDGTLKGEAVPVGVFVYVITGLTYENRSIQQKGTLTLLR